MKIIYTKREVEKVMQKHFHDTHMPPCDGRRIECMTLAPDQVTLVLGEEPAEEEL